MKKGTEKPTKKVCPPVEELNVIVNDLRCDKCNLHFRNLARFRMHHLKVHERKRLEKSEEEKNAEYHCPVESCVYSLQSGRFFATKKYLKQHYLKIHAEKKYACTQCTKSFPTEAAKDAHVKVCGTNFVCQCSKSYTTYEALLTHARRQAHVVDNKYKKSSRRSKLKKGPVIISSQVLPKLNSKHLMLPSLCIQSNLQGKARILNMPSLPHKDNSKLTAGLPLSQGKLKGNYIICIKVKVPKPKANIGIQTQNVTELQTAQCSSQCRISKSEVTQQTQTIDMYVENSKETQTSSGNLNTKTCKPPKHKDDENRKSKLTEEMLNSDVNLADNFASENLFPSSPLPLSHDVGLQDFWEDKNSSGTQTTDFADLTSADTRTDLEPFYDREDEDSSTIVNGFSYPRANGISRADPMLTEETFADRFSSIETQTEQAYCQSLFDPDSLSRSFTLNSNNETQTTETFDNIEPLHIYNNTCTQTCDEILPSDLSLSNIQTQTAWSYFVDSTVSAETQTRAFKCEPGCDDSNHDCQSWLSIQTNHMETQTDLLTMLEELD